MADGLYQRIFPPLDPRSDGYFMMSSPWPCLALCLAYVCAVQSILPRILSQRKPLEIRNLMIVYNFAMVALSAYMFLEFALSGWLAGYSYRCQPLDHSNSPQALRMTRASWLYFISKFIEFLDTIFFVLRKKNSQVTFLHVFHHTVMPISWWFMVRHIPVGMGTWHAFVNCFIHTVMYAYYGLAAFGPRFQKYLWWKRYMTKMQLTQFTLVGLHSTQLLFIDCDFPMIYCYWSIALAVIFLLLFLDFYIKAYNKPKSDSNKELTNGTVASDITNISAELLNGCFANGISNSGDTINRKIANGVKESSVDWTNGCPQNGVKESSVDRTNGSPQNGVHKTFRGSINGVTENGIKKSN